jgi:hypothetical protein
MLNNIKVLIFFIFLYATYADAEPPLSPQLIYSWPECDEKGHATTWCPPGGDNEAKEEQKDLVGRLFPDLKLGPSDIFIATYSYNNIQISNYLCSQLKKGANIEVISDYSYSQNKGLKRLSEDCGEKKAKILYLGRREIDKEWPIQHIKLIMYENSADENLTIIFGTANASLASYGLHFESWNFVRTSKDTSFAKQHLCLKKALDSAGQTPIGGSYAKEAAKFKEVLSECRKSSHTLAFDEALKREGIVPLFLPVKEDNVEEKIISAIDGVEKGSEISAATQLLTDLDLINSFIRAVERGVKVSLVLEDDTLTGAGDSRKTAVYYKRRLESSGINFKFIETNQAIPQLMHLKFILINKTLLITGSGQFSHAGLNENYENFYFAQIPQMVQDYQRLFEKLWRAGYEDPAANKDSEGGFLGRIRNFFGLD